MNNTRLQALLAASILAMSTSAMAVDLGAKTGLGVNAQVPGVSLNAGVNADAKANADVKGKSTSAVKGAKSKGDELRSEAGAFHSEAKGEVGKRTGQLDSAASVNVNAEAKVKGKAKADKK